MNILQVGNILEGACIFEELDKGTAFETIKLFLSFVIFA